MRYMQCISYLYFIIIPFFSSGFLVVVGTWLRVVGFTVSPRLGRSSFHNAIFFGRILYPTVIFGLSPMYSPRSVVYWGQGVPKGVGLLGFLKSHMEKYAGCTIQWWKYTCDIKSDLCTECMTIVRDSYTVILIVLTGNIHYRVRTLFQKQM